MTGERPPNTTRAGGYPLAFLSFWLDQQTTRGNPNQSARPATLQLLPRYGLKIPSKWGRLTPVSCYPFPVGNRSPSERVKDDNRNNNRTNRQRNKGDRNQIFIYRVPRVNSYFSARVWVNGGQVAILPFQYGYGDQFIYEAQKKLTELGYLPKEPIHRGLWSFAKGLGFDYYTSKANTNKNQMFKLYENYQEKKVTISNKEEN